MKRAFAVAALLLSATAVSAQYRVSVGAETIVRPPVPRFVSSTAQSLSYPPAFAADGANGRYLLAWADMPREGSVARLAVAALGENGAIVPGSRVDVPPQRLADDTVHFPAVAFDGTRFLVVWLEGNQFFRLVGMRFDADAKPLDPVPFVISVNATAGPIAVAHQNDGHFFITYGATTVGARVAADGTVRERDLQLSNERAIWRDAATNGRVAISVGEELTTTCIIFPCTTRSTRTIVRAAVASRQTTASVLNRTPLLGAGIASDGERFLIASWEPVLEPGGGSLIRGELTDVDGQRTVRELLISRAGRRGGALAAGGRVDVAYAGLNYAVGFEDIDSANDTDVRLAFVTRYGFTITDAVDVAADNAVAERNPLLLPLRDGRLLVLYERGPVTFPEIASRVVTLTSRGRAVAP
jgi:hypothetical protein